MVRHFSEYLAQVRYGNRSIIIEKNRSPVAEIRPLHGEECSLGDFLALWKSLPSRADFADDLERANHSDHYDMAVAATARSYGYSVLVSGRDEAHFRRVRNLKVVML